MNYKIVLIFFAFVFSYQLQAQEMPFEKQPKSGLLPVLKNNFRPQISIAPQVAYMTFSDLSISGIGYGVEIALQCPLACTKKNYIRQQISFLGFKQSDYDYWTVSINPEYRLFVKPEFELAIGPSVGYFDAKGIDNDSSGINYGLSASATFHMGNFIFSLSPRYILSKDIMISETTFSQNHFQGIFKIGYKF